MGRRGNEGKSCDAVVRLLERRSGYHRSDIRYPERDGKGPPVDLRLRLGPQEYALEHTLIEPFENEIRSGVVADQIGTYIRENPPSLPEPGYYQLVVPDDVRLPRSQGARQRALRQLGEWIVKSAESMQEENSEHWRSPTRRDARFRGQPPGFRCTFELWRWPDAALMGRRPGLLYLVRSCPDGLEGQRRRRLRRAFSQKCPKLQECKTVGARTVLVLESDDIALTSPSSVGDHLAAMLAERQDPPDDIFLVETGTDPWWTWLMKQDDDHSPHVRPRTTSGSFREALKLDDSSAEDVGRWNPTSFRRDELSDLTGRKAGR